jgi:ferric-dicitrate binding protein FerR (iron transport regulator)
LEKRPVKNDSVLAWKEHKLIFDNTPLRELVKIIKEHYGINVTLASEAVGDMTISGILPNDNLDVLLQSLDATTDFEVVRENDTIMIRGKHA